MKTLVAISLVLASSIFAQNAKHPFTFEDMMALKRVGAPVPSPNGKWVVFDCEDVDLAANTKISHLWIVPASDGESRRLNPTPNREERPRFSVHSGMFALKCQGAVDVVTGGDRISGEHVAALAKLLEVPVERGQPQVVLDRQTRKYAKHVPPQNSVVAD